MWSNILAFLKSFVTSAEGDILAFLMASAQTIEKSGGQLLISAATQAVQTAEATGGSGSDKFAAAKTAVIGTLTSQGVTVIENAVNAGLEAAVAQMNASRAAAAT